MIFYTAIDSDGRTIIRSTQEAIKDINDRAYEKVVIPDDKPGLMEWIQGLLDQTVNAEPEPVPTLTPVPTPAPAPMEPAMSKILTASYIQDWLINDASQAEIERIYNAIGCRVGEILRGERNEG